MTTPRPIKPGKAAKPAAGGVRPPRAEIALDADQATPRVAKLMGRRIKSFVLRGHGAKADVAEILGLRRGRATEPVGTIEWHDLLKEGLPGRSVGRLVDHTVILNNEDYFTAALGMSRRTLQRMKTKSSKRLSTEQSGRVFKFAEVLAKAIDVFGAQEAAEEWLASPALALDGRKPVEMLETAVGREAVEKLLIRLDYGVYT